MRPPGNPTDNPPCVCYTPGTMTTCREWLKHTGWLPAVLLVLAVLAPYYPMLTGRAIPIPDDIFISDLADGEFPLQVEAARLLSAGESPCWTSQIHTGAPLVNNPVALAFFAALPPALALGWYLGMLLAAAATGTYLLARQLGANRTGAILSGFAYAWSGVLVCQLRHLGVLGTVALFPLALFCLEMAATGGRQARAVARAIPNHCLRWLTGFAALFGLQCLAGFPQSAYYCALVYTALTASRLVWLLAPFDRSEPLARRLQPCIPLACGFPGALAIGALIGMVVLCPLHELAQVSDRSGSGTYEWATHFNYWTRDALTFFCPAINGSIADATYQGNALFWEDYGYVGLTTALLALLAMIVYRRRFAVAFWTLTAIAAFGLVLGRETPLFGLAFHAIPGFALFRLPTRMLFIVELALAILAGLGLTGLQQFLSRHLPTRKQLPQQLAMALVVATAGELVWQNLQQVPFADASTWLAPPKTAGIIRADGGEGRVFTPGSYLLHMTAYYSAHGWQTGLHPYLAQREYLQPNANLLHGLATLDGYTGITPTWEVDLVGDHNRHGLLSEQYSLDDERFSASPAFFDWLEALSVRWVILPMPITCDRLQHIGSAAPAEVYRLRNPLPRARIVTRARIVPDLAALRRLIATRQLDLHQEAALLDPDAAPLLAQLPSPATATTAGQTASIVCDRNTRVEIEAAAPQGGLLLLADTFCPGWSARVDGRPARILRANVAQRAVMLAPGAHRVIFDYHPRGTAQGRVLTCAGLILLAMAGITAFSQHLISHAAPRRSETAATECASTACRRRDTPRANQ